MASTFTAPDLRWRWCAFDALSPQELQNIYMARQLVFTIEQQCIYLDADDADAHSWHLAGWAPDGQLHAYARIVDPGIKYAEASIGRVITTAVARGNGTGRRLMTRALAKAASAYPGIGVRISAQSRLEAFYGSLGFVIVGDRYLEDGIPHTEMVLLPGLNRVPAVA